MEKKMALSKSKHQEKINFAKGALKMTDTEWLKKETEGCIESIKQKPIISTEQQGLLNVLYGTLGLIYDVEYLAESTS